jgi:hypothetical protein
MAAADERRLSLLNVFKYIACLGDAEVAAAGLTAAYAAVEALATAMKLRQQRQH